MKNRYAYEDWGEEIAVGCGGGYGGGGRVKVSKMSPNFVGNFPEISGLRVECQHDIVQREKIKF